MIKRAALWDDVGDDDSEDEITDQQQQRLTRRLSGAKTTIKKGRYLTKSLGF